MKSLTLDPLDGELFQYHLVAGSFNFFHSHISDFKRMWVEQGKTYWLRFLLTFQTNIETHIFDRPEFHAVLFNEVGDPTLSFVFILIHKRFIEAPFSTAKNFIKDIFIAAQHFHNLPEVKLHNPFYAKESREAYRSLLGKPHLHEEIPIEVIGFASTLYFAFVGAICTLLKRWLGEPDLEGDAERNVDYTLYYWRPPVQWISEDWHPSCFEKYIAGYWKTDLPKMLLTFNVHDIFEGHQVLEDCCRLFVDDMNIFDLFRDKREEFSMRVVQIKKPEIAMCKEHKGCFLRILHSDSCAEPYLCVGDIPCIISCEMGSRLKAKADVKEFWKSSMVEVFNLKGRRNVSTLAESSSREIETFCPRLDDMCHHEVICVSNNPGFRNSYSQHKRKEDYRKKLRKKLNPRMELNLEDTSRFIQLYERAQMLLFQEMCANNFKNHFNSAGNNMRSVFKHSVKGLKKNLHTVAVGTQGIVFGRVVLPSTRKAVITASCGNCDQELPGGVSKECRDSPSAPSRCEGALDDCPSSDNDDLKTFYNFVQTDLCEASKADERRRNRLRVCALCQKQEIECKTFKRCSRCKEENFPVQHYYCSRTCQVADWEKSHRQEHLPYILAT